MPVVWRPQMSVANLIIDTEHKYLLCLVNNLEFALRPPADVEVIMQSMDQLVEYTREHFQREEKMQIRTDYPLYMEHKAEHQTIMARIHEAREELLTALKGAEVPPLPAMDHAPEPADALAEPPPVPEPISDDEIASILGDARVDPPTSPELDYRELVRLLREWIIGHVLKTDLKMRPYLEKLPRNFI